VPHTTVKRATIRLPDTDLHTTRLRGIGYAWLCTCGDHGGRCATYDQARAQGHEHELSHRTRVEYGAT
jgi:hypothetical protein